MPIRGLSDKNQVKKVIVICMMVVTFFCFYFLINQASAQVSTDTVSQGVQVIEQPLGLPKTDIRLIVANIIKAALGLLGIITVSLMIYGGFIWMTAGGNEEQIGKARKILINAAIGLAIILSAYAIVLFIFRILGIGGTDNGPAYGAPGSQHFAGSGALGRIVKDHYPERDQKDVARNTKIVVTFYKPILASSTIMDTNGNGIYGDCLTTSTFSWSNPAVCDRLRTGDDKVAMGGSEDGKLDDKYINITEAKTGQSIKAAVVLASISVSNGVSGIYTLVIKPLTDITNTSGGYLGSSSEKVPYKVHLGPGIKLDDALNNNPSAFDKLSLGNDYYEWNFTCDTQLDTSPPYVENTYPRDSQIAPKNSVIQINFNEAMDPTGITGSFTSSSNLYYLSNGHIFLQTANTTKPIGNFVLTNGYKTLEFTSTKECEQKNACGKTMYCLPICDRSSVPCATQPVLKAGKIENIEVDQFDMLLKAAEVLSANSFEAKPFSGVMDLASNALDGDKDSKIDTAPTTTPVFPNQQKPDNYFWSFKIKNQIDLSSAYLSKVTPGPDASYVDASNELSMWFTKPMRTDSIYNIKLEEYATDNVQSLIPICYVPRTKVYVENTYTNMQHCSFLYDKRYYYLPTVPSEVEDVNYNCYYPGGGPGGGDIFEAKLDIADSNKGSKVCDGVSNCCPVTTSSGMGDLCCNGAISGSGLNYFNSSTCRQELKK